MKFKPEVTYRTAESVKDFRNGNRKRPFIHDAFKTYRELKKALPKILESNIDDYVLVSRSLRGEWGEYYENWALENGKPTIISEGWM